MVTVLGSVSPARYTHTTRDELHNNVNDNSAFRMLTPSNKCVSYLIRLLLLVSYTDTTTRLVLDRQNGFAY